MADRNVKTSVTSVPVVDTTKDTIFLGLNSGLKTGDHVFYDANSNTEIGGLSSLSTNGYYVNAKDDGTITLYDNKDHATAGGSAGRVDLSSGATGTGHKFYKAISVEGVDVPNLLSPITFDPNASVRELDLGSSSGLRVGDAVKYDAQSGSVIGGLADGTTYYLIDLTGGKFQLAASRQDAFDGKAINLTSDGNTNQKLVDQTDTSIVQATSGAGGGKIGVAGSVAVNVVGDDTEAVVGRTPGNSGPSTASVTLTGGKDVSLAAESKMSNVSRALPSDGGGKGTSVGVGASVAVNVVTNTVNTEITDGTSWSGSAGAFSASASSVDAGYTHGENGASAAMRSASASRSR